MPNFLSCGIAGDSDGDKVQNRTEFCFYNTNPFAVDTDLDPTDGPAPGALTKDGCEIASLNGDRTVNSIDQGMVAAAIAGGSLYIRNIDVNKDGVINSIDQGMVASFITPAGQCPP
jgi:hypothetical protein